MNHSIRRSGPAKAAVRIAGCFGIVAALVAPDGFAASDDPISGPPVINARYGTRDVRKCAAVKHVPGPAEAAALVQCFHESAVGDRINLWQNVRVQIGGPRAYAYKEDSRNSSIDTTAKVYPIRVTADNFFCGMVESYPPSPNCTVAHTTNGEGTCVRSTFGDWGCSFDTVSTADRNVPAMPKPKTY